MAARIDNLITASTYNAIRSRVNRVVGIGDGAEFGYGQTLQSSLMSDNDLITAADMENLYNDIVLAAKHQSGDPPVWTTSDGLNAPDTGEIIGVYAAELGAPITTTNPTTGEEIVTRNTLNATIDTDEGYLDFEQAATQIETNYLTTGSGALTTTVADTSVRTTPWNTQISHVFTVQWNSAEHRRTWANAGGKIRFNANLTGGTSQPGDETQTPPGTKDEIWQTMLNTMGTVEMGVLGTSTTGTGTAASDVSIYFASRAEKRDYADSDGLTFGGGSGSNANTSEATALTIFTKNGSGVYSENEYKIKVWEVDTNALRFSITLNDFDIGDSQDPNNLQGVSVPIDESVTGFVTSTISLVTPNGFLDIDIPAVTNDSPL